MLFSLRSVPVIGVFVFLFLAGCVQPGQGNQTSVCGDKIVSGAEQCDLGSPCRNGSLVCGTDCLCRPPEKRPVTCADNTLNVSNGSANRFNSSAMVCKDDCARISPDAYCDAGTCLCKTETRSCVRNSFEASSGNNTFIAALMACKDDCGDIDPGLSCDPGSCTCQKKENETFYCVNNTKDVALTHENRFDDKANICKDDCSRLGPDFFCNAKNCTCFQVPKKDMPCGANTIMSALFGNAFNPATMLCKDDCAAAFGAGWKCDGPTCTCGKKPPEKESCADNSFNIAFGAANKFDPASMKCEDDCKDIGPGWACDGKTCTCSKKPEGPVSCLSNAFDVAFGAENGFNPASMKCEDDCAEWLDQDWYCDAVSCECKRKPAENQTASCSSNTLTVNYGKGPIPAGTQCKDDCKALNPNYVCDPQGCFCKETRTVTPRCGDGYVSAPSAPGGGFEECDVGYGIYQPKDAAGNPITKPDTCPQPKVCDARSCKCLTPVAENYSCGGKYSLVPGSYEGISVPDSSSDDYFCVEPPVCGDGKTTGTEQCDWNSSDTNKCAAGSYCTSGCACKKLETSPRCGDGKISVETGEQCDGGSVNTNICQSGYKCYTPECKCVPLEGSSQCGDGTVVAPEECDHGNTFTAQCPSGKSCYSCRCVDYGDIKHTECDFVHEACISVQGPGLDECASDSQCLSPESQQCGNGEREGTEQCDGADDSACGSGQVCNADCRCQDSTTVAYHLECRQNACVQVQGSGSSMCNSDDDCVPPMVDCPAYCESEGYSESLGSYSSSTTCKDAAAESPVQCTTTCIYTKFYSVSNQAGTTTCCCKAKYTYACDNCPAAPGTQPYCQQCPASKP